MTATLTIARREIARVLRLADRLRGAHGLAAVLRHRASTSWRCRSRRSRPARGANLLEAFFGGTALFWLPLLVFAPVLTMRLLAEERASGTIEALMTAPVSELQIVLGKYLARDGLLGRAVDADAELRLAGVARPARTWSTTARSAPPTSACSASAPSTWRVGLFMSAVARNQIVAALLTFLVLGGLFVLGLFSFVTLDDQLARGVRVRRAVDADVRVRQGHRRHPLPRLRPQHGGASRCSCRCACCRRIGGDDGRAATEPTSRRRLAKGDERQAPRARARRDERVVAARDRDRR